MANSPFRQQLASSGLLHSNSALALSRANNHKGDLMKDRTRFLLYALIFVFFLGIVAGLVSAWAYEKKGLVLVLTALISGAIVMFLALYNYQPLRTERDRERALLKRVQDSWVESLSELQRFAPGASLIDLEYRRP